MNDLHIIQTFSKQLNKNYYVAPNSTLCYFLTSVGLIPIKH